MQVFFFLFNCIELKTINSENLSLEKCSIISNKTDIVSKTNRGDVSFVDNLEHSICDLFVRNIIIMMNANPNDNKHIHKHVYCLQNQWGKIHNAKKQKTQQIYL